MARTPKSLSGRTEEEIREFITRAVIEEMNLTNMIAEGSPEQWVPRFVETLSKKIHRFVMDEVKYNKIIG